MMGKLSSSRWFLAALIYCIFIVLPADAHKEHGPKEISKLSISVSYDSIDIFYNNKCVLIELYIDMNTGRKWNDARHKAPASK